MDAAAPGISLISPEPPPIARRFPPFGCTYCSAHPRILRLRHRIRVVTSATARGPGTMSPASRRSGAATPASTATTASHCPISMAGTGRYATRTHPRRMTEPGSTCGVLPGSPNPHQTRTVGGDRRRSRAATRLRGDRTRCLAPGSVPGFVQDLLLEIWARSAEAPCRHRKTRLEPSTNAPETITVSSPAFSEGGPIPTSKPEPLV